MLQSIHSLTQYQNAQELILWWHFWEYSKIHFKTVCWCVPEFI